MGDETQDSKRIEITEQNGRTSIVSRKAILKGKVTPGDVLDAVLIAARLQAEKYIEKLSRGAPLEAHEVKSLKELAEISKIDVSSKVDTVIQPVNENIDQIKQTLYQALTDKLSSKS